MREELIVFRATDDNQVFPVVASGTGEAQAVEYMTNYPNADVQLFFGYLQVLPMDAEEDDEPEWIPGRWHRLITPDGELWLETSDPSEIEDELSGKRYQWDLEDAEPDDEVLPTPEGLIHQVLFETISQHEWRNV